MNSKSRASAKYDKTHTKGYYLKLNKDTDKDIIDFLETVPSVQGLIKILLRKEIDRRKLLVDTYFNK